MAKTVFMSDPATGRVALFDELDTISDATDPNSTRNAPLNSPVSYLEKVHFNSDFDYLEVAFELTKTISHGAIAAGSTETGANTQFSWHTATEDKLLKSHNLGYKPFALVAFGDNIIWPGMPVQTNGVGGGRYATVYVDNNDLRIYTTGSGGTSGLSATDLDYDILIFKTPPAASGIILREFDPATGEVTMGFGKFNSSRQYLQVVSGGTPFGISLGRSIDLKRGAQRFVRPDGTFYEPVPNGLKFTITPGAGDYGTAIHYDGSYAGPTAIEVQAP